MPGQTRMVPKTADTKNDRRMEEYGDPLRQVQALVESECANVKEVTYLKICDALRRAYDARENIKVFEIVLSRAAANATVVCDGVTDVSVHMWSSPATLTCKLMTPEESMRTPATPLALLLQGKYRTHWAQKETPYTMEDSNETVTVLSVRSMTR